jgi:asparagine synthase (glutamine-hydrolysing)
LVVFDESSIVHDDWWGLPALEYYVWLLDAPMFRLEFFLKHELHRAARSLVPAIKVMLLGQGADEFAGGYSYVAGRSQYNDWSGYLREVVAPQWMAWCETGSGLAATLARYASRSYLEDELDAAPQAWFHRDMIRQASVLQRYNLWHEDRTAAGYGIESRVPFLDRSLVEFLASIPGRLHKDLFWRKTIVRLAAARWLPSWMLSRPKVPLFSVTERHSVSRLLASLVVSAYPSFRDKYCARPSRMFEPERLDSLFLTAQRGPNDSAASELLKCMTWAIFRSFVNCPDSGIMAAECRPSRPVVTTSDVGGLGWSSH